MFLGHFGVGLAGKRFAPRAPLALLLFAPLLLDGLWPVFLLLGWEQVVIDPGNTRLCPFDFVHYPWSHSLLMVLVWSGVVAFGYRMIMRDTGGAWWLGFAVASHWFMDLIVHRPDLPLWPGGPRVGLGLWNVPAVALILEVVAFSIGIWLYLRVTRPRGWKGRLSLWSMIVVAATLYLMSLAPLPSDTTPRAIALGGLAVWLFIPWAWWIESTRRTVR
ncbi:MAG TPA: hypothetical protein VJY35_16625 [Candidatus Eisenbacteria bacterium]|nr:hypothetical protein [Candidatus Eisenbacteria bacterium]